MPGCFSTSSAPWRTHLVRVRVRVRVRIRFRVRVRVRFRVGVLGLGLGLGLGPTLRRARGSQRAPPPVRPAWVRVKVK
eukprot:scaffold1551_cov48-Phaeocystis_antarctica.AAC.1